MDNFKRVSISVIIALVIGILIVSFNRQPDTIGVGASTPMVFSEQTSLDLVQTNNRISNVENNIRQISEQQQVMLKSVQELISLSKKNNETAMSSDSRIKKQESLISKETTVDFSNSISPEQKLEEATLKDNQQFALKESQFYNEIVDDGWRSNEESKLNSIFEENQISADNLECRGSSCRVELASNNSDDADDAMDRLIRALPNSEGEFKYEQQANGSFKTIMIIKSASF